jgi:hypothetical protein
MYYIYYIWLIFCKSISRTNTRTTRTRTTVTTMTVTTAAATVMVIVIIPISLLECLPTAEACKRQLLKINTKTAIK